MEICITDARGRLGDLIRWAETGDDIVLTRNGIAVARIIPFRQGAAVESDRLLDSDAHIRGARQA